MMIINIIISEYFFVVIKSVVLHASYQRHQYHFTIRTVITITWKLLEEVPHHYFVNRNALNHCATHV